MDECCSCKVQLYCLINVNFVRQAKSKAKGNFRHEAVAVMDTENELPWVVVDRP
jgi:hypothetical protein